MVARLNGIQKVGGSIPPGSTIIFYKHMSSVSFVLIMISALMHASWNFYTKKSAANKIAMLWIGWLIAGFITFPIALVVSDFSFMSIEWLPYFVATAIVHALYIYLLGWSYSIGEMSLMYPIARGIGILVTMIIVLLLELESISDQGFLGVSVLVLGIVFVSIKRFRDIEKRAAIFVAIGVGICISLYSIIDKLSILHIPPVFYISIMFITSPLLLAPLMLTSLKAQTIAVWKKHKYYSGLIGLVSLLTYLLILFALKDSPAPYVVALREISIVFGAILGICMLKEERNKRKIFGLVLILIGAVIIKIA